MHDDETSKAPSANRMPWEAGYEAPPQHPAPQPGPPQQQAWGQPQQTWQNASAQGWQQGSVAMDPTTSTRVDKPSRGIGAWVLPIMLVLAGVAAFAIVTFFMTGKSNDGPSSVSAPVSGQAPPSTSQSPSSTPSSSTSEAHDDFPADAVTTCADGDDTVENAASDVVRRVNSSSTSCVFLQAVRSKVLEHVSGDPKATSFQITAHSQATNKDYVMTCQRTNHVSYCSGGNNAAMYVKDTIS